MMIFWVLYADSAQPGVIRGERVSGSTGTVLAEHHFPSIENAALNLEARGFVPLEIGPEERGRGILEVWRGQEL